MNVAQELGTEKGKAINELVAVSIEAAHDDLATKELVKTEIDTLRKSMETGSRWVIGIMLTGFVSILVAIITFYLENKK